MFSQRWSTFSLLCVFALAIALGYCIGKSPRGARAFPVSQTDSEPVAQTIPAPQPDAPPQNETAPTPKPDSRCLELFSRLQTPARDNDLVAAIEKLAGQYPLRAIELARAEKNSRLRERLLDAAFRGWGKADANAAADWILSGTGNAIEKNAAIASVFKGAVDSPESAVQLAQRLVQADPEQARDYGDALIYALALKGNFSRAADFAAGGNDPQLRAEWLAAAYGSWVNYQPENAAVGAMGIQDAESRIGALNAVISGWGQIDPKGLAEFAANHLPDGNQKTLALSQALNFWAATNPEEVAVWINKFGPSPAFDAGEAAIATQPQVMGQPSLAVSWAETIADPNLRSRTLAAVVETWMLSNSAAALSFVQTSDDLLPEDRNSLLSKF